MGLFGKKKNKTKEAVEEVKEEVKKQIPVKKGKNYVPLTELFNESDYENIKEDFENNSRFKKDGKYSCIVFDGNELGFTDKKAIKNKHGWGAFLQLVENSKIDVYTAPELLKEDKFIIIPNEKTIESLREFTDFNTRSFDVAEVTEDGKIEITDFEIKFADLCGVYDNHKSFYNNLRKKEEEVIEKKEESGEASVQETKEEGIKEAGTDEGSPSEPKVTEDTSDLDDIVDALPTEETSENIIDMNMDSIPDDNEDDTLFDTNDETDSDEEVEDLDEEEPVSDEEGFDLSDEEEPEEETEEYDTSEEEIPVPEFVSPGDLRNIIVRHIKSDSQDERVREITSEEFDLAFGDKLENINTDVFSTVPVTGMSTEFETLFNNHVSVANDALSGKHYRFVSSLRDRYVKIMSEVASMLSKDVSYDEKINGGKDLYGFVKEYKEISDKALEVSNNMERMRGDIERRETEKYQKDMDEYVKRKTENAKREFNEIHKMSYDMNKQKAKDDAEIEIKGQIDEAFADLKRKQDIKYDYLFMAASNNTINKLLGEYKDFMEDFKTEIDKETDGLRKFVNDNMEDDVKRSSAITALENEREENRRIQDNYKASLDSISKSYDTRIVEIENSYKEKMAVLEGRIKERNDYWEEVNKKHEEERKSLLNSLEDLRSSSDTLLTNAKNSEETTRNQLQGEIAKLNETVEATQKQSRHTARLLGWLMVAVGISCGAVGVIAGFFIAH